MDLSLFVSGICLISCFAFNTFVYGYSILRKLTCITHCRGCFFQLKNEIH